GDRWSEGPGRDGPRRRAKARFRARRTGGLRPAAGAEDLRVAGGAPVRERPSGRALARIEWRGEAGLVSGPAQPSRSRSGATPDERFRRDGDVLGRDPGERFQVLGSAE